MPRLLHVIDDWRPHGAAAQLLAAQWRVEGSSDDRTRVAVGRWPVVPSASDAERVGLGRRFRLDPFATARLAKLLRAFRPDVVQTWDRASARLVSAVQRYHGLRGARWIARLDPGARPSPARSADLLLTTDQHTADSVTTTFGQSAVMVVKDSCISSLQPADGDARRAARARFRAAGVDLPDESTCILVVDDFEDAFGLKQLVWASDLFRVVRPGLRVLVVGDGPARMACERFAAGAAEPGLITWLGHQANLTGCYAAADMVWTPPGPSPVPPSALAGLAADLPIVMATDAARDSLWDESPTVATIPGEDRAAWPRASTRLLDDPAPSEISAAWRATFLADRSVDVALADHTAAVQAVLSTAKRVA